MRIFVLLALAMALLVPVTAAQKPPAPAPPPAPSPAASHPATPGGPLGSQPTQPEFDLVMFLMGRVATDDGTAVPHDVVVERVCQNNVRQQVYASTHGDFSMELGSRTDSYLDASGNPASQVRENETRNATMGGIPRLELKNCELRASASGFRPGVISLIDLSPSSSTVDVGAIVVQRAEKIKGMTVSAAPYQAPPNARKAYEKGLEAGKNGKLAEARKYFEQAVEIYPKYASAWFQLGAVFEKENETDAARKAYTQAMNVDTKFLPPYLSLASMAYKIENWTEVLTLTGHIMALDPLNHTNITGYILDLDPLDYAQVYFYNSVANYKLNKTEEAEKSGVKAEHIDLRPRFPQLHLLLAEIFAGKKNYPLAISELRTYLELVPHAKNADQAREWLTELQKLNSAATTKNPDPK